MFSRDKHQPDGLNNKCRICCKEAWSKYSAKKFGAKPMTENKECSQYLGIVVAEKLLSHVFKNVERFPLHHHGYDFICGGGFKIDVKSSDIISRTKNAQQWQFDIRNNRECDYFLCIAFNRAKLEPLKMWLIPNRVVSHLKTLSIGRKNFSKWAKYEQPIDKALACCASMKSNDGEA
jgi:hypothetical protein